MELWVLRRFVEHCRRGSISPMKSSLLGLLFISLFVFVKVNAEAQPASRYVAITIDDLPYANAGFCDPKETVAITQQLLEPIRAKEIPAVGFVIGERCKNLSAEQRRALLQLWLDAGAELGNHTWSHADLNQVELKEYERQILAVDHELRHNFRSLRLRYFRAPYLHDGPTAKLKKELYSFLTLHKYHGAPVTLDNNDWAFAAAYNRALDAKNATLAQSIEEAYVSYMLSIVVFFERRSLDVLGRECAQILLIHASRLNAKVLPELLQIFEKRGYKFITLENALRDVAYRISDTYEGPKGLSWIHRWGLANGMPILPEPAEPDWIDTLGKPSRP